MSTTLTFEGLEFSDGSEQNSATIEGATGATGVAGSDGANGTNGTNGTNGATGAQGSQGIQGIQGTQGDIGSTGIKGSSVIIIYADDVAGTNQAIIAGTREYVLYYEYPDTAPTLPVSGQTFVKFVGTDGQAVWPIYALNSNGDTQSFTSSSNLPYVTFYENTTQPSLPVSGQTFVKWIGNDGTNGLPGVNGVNGANGVNGTDGSSIVWKGSATSHLTNPVTNWAYYNTTFGITYVYSDGAWYQMSIDGTDGQVGTDGVSIVWKGDSALPPSNPIINWVYRDTDNNSVYIYNGTAWELMVLDGSDGTDGATGTDGLSIFITYNDNSASSTPSTPTGNGTTNGWHTNATTVSVWISQKVASDSTSGTWGVPIRIQGVDGSPGIPGTDGVTGTSVLIIYSDDATGTNQSVTLGSQEFVLYYEYVDTAPTLPVSGQTFVRFVGVDGSTGSTGQSVWPIYADDASGNGQSFNEGSKGYVTFYESVTSPTLPVSGQTFVKWVGTDGTNGTNGLAGTSVLIIYSDDSVGTNQSVTLGSQEFVLYYEYDGTAPTLPVSGQTFVRFVGVDGSTGSAGQSVWPIYADDASGNGQSFSEGSKGYVTFYENTTQPTLPVSGQTFVKWVGTDGTNGLPGVDGTDGTDGSSGTRGPGRFSKSITLSDNNVPDITSATYNTDAIGAITDALGSSNVPVTGDAVTLTYTKLDTTKATRNGMYNGSAWVSFALEVDGSLIVAGTIYTDAILTGAITSDKISSYNLTSANSTLGNAIVDTLTIAGNAVTQPVVFTNTASTSAAKDNWFTVASLTINNGTSVGTVSNLVSFSCFGYYTSGGDWVMKFELFRGSTSIDTGEVQMRNNQSGNVVSSFAIDTNGGGSNTYTLKFRGEGDILSSVFADKRKLYVLGAKR